MTRAIKRREIMARHSRTNTDIKQVREINIENASKDELIEYLCQTIHYEVEKGEDADCDLIRECSDWLDELTADLMVFTPEELEAKLEALKAGKDVPISQQHKPHQTASTPRIKRKVFARVGILVATIMLLSVLSLSIMAKHAGYDSTWDFIYITVEKWCGLNPGEEFSDDEITVIKNTGTVKYNDMNKFLKGESLNILYPQQIPNNEKITEIRFVNESDTNYTLYFTFSNRSYIFNVSNYYSTDTSSLSTFECISIDDLNFFITQKEGNVYFALLQNNGFEYTIQSTSYDDLLVIINDLKG